MESAVNLGIDSLVLGYYKTEFECIEKYFEKLSDSVQNEKKRILSLAEYLNSKGADEDYIADSLDDDSFNFSFFEKNTYNFAVVFLYSECEKLLKQDYGILSGKSSKSLFKFENAKRLFSEEGIDLTSLPNYSKLNEIRVLNNCIKHDGFVSQELSNLNEARWLETKKIDVQYSEVQQFLKDMKEFFDKFVPLVDSKNREKITVEDVEAIVKLCEETVASKSSEEQTKVQNLLDKLRKL